MKKTKLTLPATLISGEFNRILIDFCQEFLVYPTFPIEIPAFQLKWGTIVLPRFPSEKLKDDELFYLLTSLAYHGIFPVSHLNDLLIRTIAAKEFHVGWKSTLARVMSFLFSFLVSYSELLKRRYWRKYAARALMWFHYQLKPEGLQLLIKEIISSLLTRSKSLFAVRVQSILDSDRSIQERAKKFFNLIREYIPLNQLLLEQYEIEALPFIMHGGEWKLGETSTILEISKIDQKAALEIARLMDRGFLPAPSSRLKMEQKFRCNAVSLIRLRRRKLIKIVDENVNEGTRYLYGFRTWNIDDDERLLNVEMSVESFGKAIPGFSTLAEIKRTAQKGHIELVLDTSASMIGTPLERAIDVGLSLTEYAEEKNYSVGLITFSSGAWKGIKPTKDYSKVKRCIAALDAEGGTNLRGALGIIRDHFKVANTNLRLCFTITDSAIYDIDKEDVIKGLREISVRSRIYFVIIGEIFWDGFKRAISKIRCKVLKIPLSEDFTILRI